MSGTDGPKQVSDPDYHSVNHTGGQYRVVPPSSLQARIPCL